MKSMITIKTDGTVEPFGLKWLRDSRFQLLAPTRDKTDSLDEFDGEVDFGTELSSGVSELRCVTEEGLSRQQIINKKAELAGLFNALRNGDWLTWESDPDKKLWVKLDGRVKVQEYPSWLQVNIPLKIDPLWVSVEEHIASNPTFSRPSIAYLSNGTQVAANVPRFEAGKFGQAVMVEEGTTNLVSNPGFENDATGWTLSADMSISIAKAKSGSKSLRFYHATGTSAQATWTSSYISVSPNTQYTLSADFWNNLTQGSFYVDYFEYDSAYNILTDGKGPSSTRGLAQWERKSYTFTTKSNAAYVKIRIVADATPIGEAFVDNIQLERKPYATSFIDGTRIAEVMTVPTPGVLSPTEGTIECWVYVNDLVRQTNVNRYIFAVSDGSNSGSPNSLYLRHSATNYWSFGAVDASGNGNVVSIPDNLTAGWHFFSCRWSQSEMALIIDGSTKATRSNPYLPGSFAAVLQIGNYPNTPAGNYCSNTLIDDLRISSRYRTDEEIAAAYASGEPLPVDEDTTYKLNFDNSLAFLLYNRGTFETPVIVEIRGIVTNPEISIGGKTLRYEGTVGETDLLVIDTDKMIVTFNGINALASYTGDFPKLSPGETEVIVPANGTTTFKWRDCWI